MGPISIASYSNANLEISPVLFLGAFGNLGSSELVQNSVQRCLRAHRQIEKLQPTTTLTALERSRSPANLTTTSSLPDKDRLLVSVRYFTLNRNGYTGEGSKRHVVKRSTLSFCDAYNGTTIENAMTL